MDKQNNFIERPTLSFPAHRETKKPLWLMILGGMVMIAGLLTLAFALMSQF